MDSVPPPPETPDLFSYVMIAVVSVMFTVISVVTYRFIQSTCCLQRQDAQVSSQQNVGRNQIVDGVDEKALQSIPILAYSNKKEALFRLDQSECAVCLTDLEEGVKVRLLPNCQHAFHLQCIDEWFVCHSNCPLCRSPVTAPTTPMLTTSIISTQRNGESEITGTARDHVDDAREPELCLPAMLNRSLSMDYSYVALRIQESYERNSSPTSTLPSTSSRKLPISRSSSYRTRSISTSRSIRRLDSASSTFLKSSTLLQLSEGRRGDGILPR